MRRPGKLSFLILLLLGSIHFLSSPAESFVFEDRVSTTKALAHYAMGQVYDLLGQTNRAILEYEKSAQFDRSNYLAHLRLGANYARLDMLTKAKEELELVQQFNEDDLQSHYLLALIYSTERNYEAAAREYEYILTTFSESEPKNIEIYGYLGQLYYSQKKYKQAIVQFEKILDVEPNNADVMYLLGSLYIEIDDTREATSWLKKSLEVNPDHDGSLNTLGYIYADDGKKIDEAERLIRKALKISPNNGAYLDSLGWVQYQRGEYKKALKTFQQANAVLDDPVIFEHIGDTYFKLNDFDKAITFWEKSLQLLPHQKEVLRKLEEAKSMQASHSK